MIIKSTFLTKNVVVCQKLVLLKSDPYGCKNVFKYCIFSIERPWRLLKNQPQF